MTGRAVLTAIGPSGVRRYRIRLLRGHRQSNAPAASDRFAPLQSARRPAAWQRRRPDAENFGGEVSSCCFPEMLNASRIYFPLIFAALMIDVQRAISLFPSAASGC